MPQPSPETPRPRTVPTPVRVAAALLAVIALTSAVLGILEAFNVRSNRMVMGVGATILLLAYAAALAVVIRGLLRLRGWSRGPAVATQVVQLPVAYSFLGGGTTWIGVLLAAISLTVIVCLVLPSSTRALVPHLLTKD
ncbi:hypothetical protein AADG42_08440 [Ammonicoccus fulvus]|uniref:Integral membrane protein n=1 Tax=Ammonicoccus fulvus TaxID=3138240 RepID=A0ABZ3FNQ1_9ACTN